MKTYIVTFPRRTPKGRIIDEELEVEAESAWKARAQVARWALLLKMREGWRGQVSTCASEMKARIKR